MIINKDLILDAVHPVGSVYISTEGTNPHDLFGGTWVQIAKGRTLMGEGTVEANTDNWCGYCNAGEWTAYNGLQGGEVKHYLSHPELPVRTTYQLSVGQNDNIYGSMNYLTDHASGWAFYNTYDGWVNGYLSGSGLPHNNMPPYLVVYIWKRTA